MRPTAKLLVYLMLACAFSAHAQVDSAKFVNKFNYGFELGGYFSVNDKIPFWQKSNKFGSVPQNGNSLYFRQVLMSKKDTTKRFFSADYCIDLVTIVGEKPLIILPEAFVGLNFGDLRLSGGRMKSIHGLVDTTLSSGSVTWSGNSLPLPEVRLSIPEYKRLFADWLSFKGHYSHGWFGEQTFVKGSFLHQKSLYARIGSPLSKIHFYGGVLHSVQWGGTPKYDAEGFGKLTDGKFPADWYTYGQVVIPYEAVVDTTLGYGGFETENRFGNHVSQIDLGMDFSVKNGKIMLYKNNIIETGRTLGSFSNLDDGLYGFSFHNYKEKAVFKKVVFEYLFSMNQGSYNALIARLLNKPLKDYGNNGFYFNHQQYLDGWSYETETIGSPFFVPDDELKLESSKGNFTFSNSNRLKVFYLATQMQLNSIGIVAKGSYSQNFGSIWFPVEPLNQLNTSFEFKVPLKAKNSFIKVDIGIDHGELIKDNYGINFAYQRFW
ncbi:capsule assembly Wzi family protein [Arcticibacterium luteifluviistationis]|uniref:Capsule assembly Wzi family protein n=1 Tax=Arcticibacterium luteifluviistationis TaxID=1784714 RepID=A0A2Z4G8I6_9BACT|nr:capsule assembly Wzi family protein [Arcticibacterium luteifluviistationis]AWV97507.1 hypothetical protein DJ013_04725 [Arcticibacterium luteifluviistationis]